ncbi:YfcC family protein [Balneola sp. MJW-20]|uniref:YfcC family protein n=1 Tax=Gracilimonas aurantiaca TaxID=3234185 RepID=UPI0034658DFF
MKFSFPHPLAILLFCIALAATLTHIIPSGAYDRTSDAATGREVVVSGSYKQVEAEPIGVFDAIVKVPEGIIFGAEVVVLILIIGGAFVVVDKTGAFSDGIEALVNRFHHSPHIVMILVGCVFALAGLLNNTQEEIIAMVPFLILMTDRLGYMRISAIAISTGSAAIGAAFSPVNPFGVLIAQKISAVEPFSGTIFRLTIFAIVLVIWIWWILKKGRMHSSAIKDLEHTGSKLPARSAMILVLVLLTFSLMIYGILIWDWDYNQMSSLFLVMGLFCGLIGGLGINGTSKAYANGFQEMAFAAVLVGLARSLYLILEEGMIIDTIVHGLFSPLQDLPVAFSAIGMTLSQAIIHIPVPSNSGQAVLTIPLLTPLSDLIGMSRQVMILCYQYGGMLTDMITPTNGALLAVLAASGVGYNSWVKFIWKPFLMILGTALLSIIIGIYIGI